MLFFGAEESSIEYKVLTALGFADVVEHFPFKRQAPAMNVDLLSSEKLTELFHL